MNRLSHVCTNEEELLTAIQSTHQSAVKYQDYKQVIDATLHRFKEVFRSYDDGKEFISEIFTSDSYLNDRINTIRGVTNIAEYLHSNLKGEMKVLVSIEDEAFSEKDIYIRWSMRTEYNGKNSLYVGMTQLRFNHDGKIILHQDHWDFSRYIEDMGSPEAQKLITHCRESL